MPHRIVLDTADAELARVEQEARAGWTCDLVGRALAALRLTGAALLARPVAQHPHDNHAPSEGRLSASVGLLRRRSVQMSSALTPLEMQAALTALPTTVTATRRQALEDLYQAIRIFTAALYGSAELDGPALDRPLGSARSATGRARQR